MGLPRDGHGGNGDPAAPAGWYPVDGGLQRYWDGSRWTEHTAPIAGSPPSSSPVPPVDLGSGQTQSLGYAPTHDPESGQPLYPGSGPAPGAGPNPIAGLGPDPGAAPTPWVDGAPADQPFAAQSFATPRPVGAPPGGPPSPYHPGPPAALSADDRSMALLAHLLTFVSGFLGPLIVWLVKRDQSPFVDHHGKEALNFQISLFVYWIAVLFASLFLIGLLLIPVLLVLQILFPILAAISANRGEYYRYPMSLRFIT